MAVVAAAMLIASTILLGAAASKMGMKAKNEFECGSSGRDMQEHVDTLNDMLGQQEGYIEPVAKTPQDTVQLLRR